MRHYRLPWPDAIAVFLSSMRDSRRTSLLLTAAIALLVVHFFPYLAAPIAWSALAAGVVWVAVVGWRLLARYQIHRSHAAKLAADDVEYRSYEIELNALRARHDPKGDWNESTDFPEAYRESLNALHERYKAMLTRRFGPKLNVLRSIIYSLFLIYFPASDAS